MAVAAGLMFASWLWNVFLRRHELEREIESVKSEITSKVEEDFTKLNKRFNDQAVKMRDETERTVEKGMILLDAEKARLFGLSSMESKSWERAVDWWAEAIVGYAKAGQEQLLRTMVDALNDDLDKCKKLEDNIRKNIKESLSSIPKVLRKERKQIENKLKKLPKEITKQSETRPN